MTSGSCSSTLAELRKGEARLVCFQEKTRPTEQEHSVDVPLFSDSQVVSRINEGVIFALALALGLLCFVLYCFSMGAFRGQTVCVARRMAKRRKQSDGGMFEIVRDEISSKARAWTCEETRRCQRRTCKSRRGRLSTSELWRR